MKKMLMSIIAIIVGLFSISVVNAKELNEYKYASPAGGSLHFYSDFVDGMVETNLAENNEGYEKSYYIIMFFDIYSQEEQLKMIENNANAYLYRVPEMTKKVTRYERNFDYRTIEDYENSNSEYEELEIIEKDGQKYVAVHFEMEVERFGKYEDKYTAVRLGDDVELIVETEEEKTLNNVGLVFYSTTPDYVFVPVNIVSENGMVYTTMYFDNAYTEGFGLSSFPSDVDLSKTYIEYLMPEYVGEKLSAKYIGDVPYVGKYNDYYKYKVSLENATFTGYQNRYLLPDIDYKGLIFFEELGFWLDDDYYSYDNIHIQEAVYDTKTSDEGSVKVSVEGKIAGDIWGPSSLFVEEIDKEDLIYGKVKNELDKTSKDSLYTVINNVHLSSMYDSELKLTFYVGNEFDGMKYNVVHMINNKYEFEKFIGIVNDGIITVTVNHLSPFGISIYKDEIVDPSNDDKKDDSDKKDDNTNTDNKETEDKKPVVDNVVNVVDKNYVVTAGKNPHTGDNLKYSCLPIILLVSALVFFISDRKLKSIK